MILKEVLVLQDVTEQHTVSRAVMTGVIIIGADCILNHAHVCRYTCIHMCVLLHCCSIADGYRLYMTSILTLASHFVTSAAPCCMERGEGRGSIGLPLLISMAPFLPRVEAYSPVRPRPVVPGSRGFSTGISASVITGIGVVLKVEPGLVLWHAVLVYHRGRA